jgi:lipopolysaccharide biosynthesis glycosyltransferase
MAPSRVTGAAATDIPVRNAVVFCVDSAYLLPCAFMIDQLAADPSTGRYDVVLIHHGVSEAILSELRRRARRPVQTIAFSPEILARFGRPQVGYLSSAVYLRLYLDRLLPAHYERILYLDADMYFERYEVLRLFEMDLGGAALAAVDDALLRMELLRPDLLPDSPPRAWRGPEGVRAYRTGLGLGEDAAYFNSGLLLIDRPRWSALDMDGRALAFIEKHPDRCLLADQSALNAVAAGHWVELSPRYNFQTMQSQAGLGTLLHPAIRHFTGPHKPWNAAHSDAGLTEAYRNWLASSGWSEGFTPVPGQAAPPGGEPRRKARRPSWVGRLRRRLRGETADGGTSTRQVQRIFAAALLAGMRDAPFVDFDAAARRDFLDGVARFVKQG